MLLDLLKKENMQKSTIDNAAPFNQNRTEEKMTTIINPQQGNCLSKENFSVKKQGSKAKGNNNELLKGQNLQNSSKLTKIDNISKGSRKNFNKCNDRQIEINSIDDKCQIKGEDEISIKCLLQRKKTREGEKIMNLTNSININPYNKKQRLENNQNNENQNNRKDSKRSKNNILKPSNQNVPDKEIEKNKKMNKEKSNNNKENKNKMPNKENINHASKEAELNNKMKINFPSKENFTSQMPLKLANNNDSLLNFGKEIIESSNHNSLFDESEEESQNEIFYDYENINILKDMKINDPRIVDIHLKNLKLSPYQILNFIIQKEKHYEIKILYSKSNNSVGTKNNVINKCFIQSDFLNIKVMGEGKEKKISRLYASQYFLWKMYPEFTWGKLESLYIKK